MDDIKILLVEDDDVDAKYTEKLLKDMGFRVVERVINGREAIHSVMQHQPDLVLMDVKLPGEMDGIKAADQIIQQFDIPIVFVTGIAQNALLKKAQKGEPVLYVQKPIQAASLNVNIDTALYIHQAHKKLKKSEHYLSTILNSIGDAVIATDEKGIIKFMNPIAEGITGWKSRFAIGEKLPEVFKIIDKQTHRLKNIKIDDIIDNGKISDISNEVLLISKLGRKISIENAPSFLKNSKGEPSGVVMVFRDITERKKSEELLKIRERAISSSINGIAFADLEGNLDYVNNSFIKMWGYESQEQILTKHLHAFFKNKDRFSQILKELLENKVWSGQGSAMKKDGTTFEVLISASCVEDENGEPTSLMASFITLPQSVDLRKSYAAEFGYAGIIGRSNKMKEVFDSIKTLSNVNVSVLIQGESGTGKELVAKAIHDQGIRKNSPFVAINCGALPDSLLESELFGYQKGAFTGAITNRKGRFELADGGTIFLDELGEVSPAMQVKLLRVLEEGTFERLGSETTIKVDVRVISATNRDLKKEVSDGTFREDLYYRLAVVPIELPPLRKRRDDIALLIEHFLEETRTSIIQRHVELSQKAMDMLTNYDWPGNVRELQNAVQHALVKCQGEEITPVDLPPTISKTNIPEDEPTGKRVRLSVDAVKMAMEQTNNNRAKAARMLGVSRATFYRFLTAHDMV